jgi:hypothetical protein
MPFQPLKTLSRLLTIADAVNYAPASSFLNRKNIGNWKKAYLRNEGLTEGSLVVAYLTSIVEGCAPAVVAAALRSLWDESHSAHSAKAAAAALGLDSWDISKREVMDWLCDPANDCPYIPRGGA